MSTQMFVVFMPFWIITSVVTVTVVVGGTCNISQSPAELTVEVGANIQLFCTWISDYRVETIRILWLKDGEQKHSTRENASKPAMNGTFSFNITSFKADDSGLYRCEVTVEIPSLASCYGTGTNLTVKDSPKETKPFPQYLLIAAICGGSLILLTITLSASLCKFFRRRQWEDHTYSNTSRGQMVKVRKKRAKTRT
ncbi:hypothetical protein JZ751_025618 [Albula glossodonta]|uniref:Ig-like domain-containing protein n=1 Tax=Albula glossodonta TaxID=121402 RepID=A0A8T2NGX9_9TELE|nr:hypothetical protein JZ751_025618 [Albula glossodonta]